MSYKDRLHKARQEMEAVGRCLVMQNNSSRGRWNMFLGSASVATLLVLEAIFTSFYLLLPNFPRKVGRRRLE